MKLLLRALIIFSVLVLLPSMTKHNQPTIEIIRGLENHLTQFNELEQKFIKKVAEKLSDNGFPLHQLTRIELKKRINSNKDYYAYNEVILFINPAIYKEGFSNTVSENIGVGWEHPTTKRHTDGSVEFEFGKNIKTEDFFMEFYRLNDTYHSYPLLDDHSKILQKIDDVLRTTDVKEIRFFASKGIEELIKNYHVHITSNGEDNEIYKLTIGRMEYGLLDLEHFHTLHKNYSLKLDLRSSQIEILSSYDPNLFPSPAPNVLPEESNKKKNK